MGAWVLKRFRWLLLFLPIVTPACSSKAPEASTLLLGTTTSVMDSGLLEPLIALFEQSSEVRVKPIVAGSGAVLEMARRGDVDLVLVHSPQDEKRYVDAGDLLPGALVMTNDFLIVGPREDPAAVRAAHTAVQAMTRIGARGTFVSRGDGSGTERLEQRLWERAKVEPQSLKRRLETGTGMGATLHVADQRNAYTIVDRGTYLSARARLRIVPLFEGDTALLNVYHVYRVNPARHRRFNADAANRFADFVVSPPAQRFIASFGQAQYGEPLFRPAVTLTTTKR
jgi:tungstate transport system substrate-binding protein